MSLGIAIILFCLGVGLIVLELFIPSFGLLSVAAIVSFAFSVWEAYKEHPNAAIAMAILAPVISIVVVYFGLRLVPRTAWGRGLVLRHPSDAGSQAPPTSSESATLTPEGGTDEKRMLPLVGKEGVAQSFLRPAGVAILDGRRVDVVTEGGIISAGARIKVVAVEGNRVIVRRVQV